MKILAEIKKRPLVLGILFAMLIIGIVYAADSYKVNSGATSTIDEHGVCKKVTNNNALAIFVPTKTADEWTAFRTYASGVSLADCIYCDDSDGDGYGECPNCGIAMGCTYDGDDCNDNNATVWRLRYRDSDGDGHCPSSSKYCVGTQSGYRDSCSSYNDCCDTDSRAHPGQSSYYTSTNNCGSWDYNCDGTSTGIYCSGYTQCQIDFPINLYCTGSCSTPTLFYGKCTPVTPLGPTACGDSWVEASCPSRSCYHDINCGGNLYTKYWCKGTSRTCSCH